MIKILEITVIVYLIGLLLCFILSVREVKRLWKFKNHRELLGSTLKNAWRMYLASWYGVVLILLKRKLK